MKAKKLFIVFMLMLAFPVVLAEESEFEDPEIFGLEIEKLLFFLSANLAAALAILTYIAYSRTNRSKLLYITAAFSLFSIKLFLLSSELFFDEWVWLDLVTALLDFAILLSFFFGIIKKWGKKCRNFFLIKKRKRLN